MKFSANVMEECSRELDELEEWFATWQLKEKKEAPPPPASSTVKGFSLNTPQQMRALAEVRSSEMEELKLGCLEVALAPAGGRKLLFDVAAIEAVGKGSDVKKSSKDASDVATFGKGFALGINSLGKKRPRAKDGRAESAPLVHGQVIDGEARWWAESSEGVEKFKGWKGPQMPLKGARCPPHVGDIFRSVVRRHMRENKMVTDAAVLQRRITTVSVAAQFFWVMQRDFASFGTRRPRAEKTRVTTEKRKLEVKSKTRWGQVARAAQQAAQPTERARVLVQAKQQTAQQGQWLVQLAYMYRGAEGVRIRGVLARALYNWGLGHAQDQSQYGQLVALGCVWCDIVVRCRESMVTGTVFDWWA